MDATSHHTQLLRDSYPVQLLCKTTFLHVGAGEPFQGSVAILTTIRKNSFERSLEFRRSKQDLRASNTYYLISNKGLLENCDKNCVIEAATT